MPNDNLFHDAMSIENIDEFKQWTRKVIRPIFPHAALGCEYSRIHAGGVGADGIIAIDYPIKHLENICNRAGGIDTPILRRWFATRQPQLFEVDSPWPNTPTTWLEHFKGSGLKNIAAHAVLDTTRCIGTYHSFHSIPGFLNETHGEILARIVPIMHDVLCRVIGNLNEPNRINIVHERLSDREQEVLRLVSLGKINGEIAESLFLSETTIKHCISDILEKLGMRNRSQLTRFYVEHEIHMRSKYGLKIF